MDVGPHAQPAAVTRKIIWSVGNLIHQPKTGSVYFSEENVVPGMATNYFLMDWFYTKAQKLLVLSGFLNQKFAGNLIYTFCCKYLKTVFYDGFIDFF